MLALNIVKCIKTKGNRWISLACTTHAVTAIERKKKKPFWDYCSALSPTPMLHPASQGMLISLGGSQSKTLKQDEDWFQGSVLILPCSKFAGYHNNLQALFWKRSIFVTYCHIPPPLLCCFKSELVFKYLWEGSRIKSKHFLVTTGIYSCPSWAQSTCYTWIKNWLRMVLAMGEFGTQETLHQNKKRHNERWDYLWKFILHYKECISNFIATPQNANTQ